MAFRLSRRKFLQTASLAAASVPLSKVRTSKAALSAEGVAPGSFTDTKDAYGGICEMCFWRCQLVGKVRDGKLVKIEGNPKSIDNGTSLCARGNAGIKLLYDPDRLKYPLKNVGERGNPKWKRISWKEALDECGSKLKAVIDKHGGHAISMYPHGASAKYPMHYFERVVGTPNVSEASFFQCRGIRDTAYVNTFGTTPGEHVDMANAKAIFLLGCHFGENVHVSHAKRYLKGLENGAKLIVVDPRFSSSAAKADIWVKIKPSTDTAFLLAIMNYLVKKGKHNEEFVDEYGDGFDEFKEAISHATLEWASKECDVPASQIKEVAETLATNAPNVSVHPGRYTSWYGNDFQRVRALGCLTGLLGAVGVKGGFVKPKGPKGVKKVSWPHVGHAESHSLRKLGGGLYPYSPPGTPTDLVRDTMVSGKPYPIKACVVWGQNPIQTIPNQPLTIQGLKNMDFVLAVDVMPTDITMYADILLPESSYLERHDYIKKGTQFDLSGKQEQFISARQPLVDPLFERKDSIYITNEIAKRLGHAMHIPANTVQELVDKQLAGAGLSLAKLTAAKGIHVQPGKDPYGVPEDFEVSFFNEELVENGFPGAPTYKSVEHNPKGYARLLYGRTPLHSFNRTQNNAWLNFGMPENPIWVNDEHASKMGLNDGDRVKLVSSDGVVSTNDSVVKVTPGISKYAVYIAHGFGSKNEMLSVAKGKGIDDQELITKPNIDPETGAHGMRTAFVKIMKDGKKIDFPA